MKSLRLLSVLILCFCIILNDGYSVYPQRWSIRPNRSSLHCKVAVMGNTANISLDSGCLVERNLTTDFEVSNFSCSDSSFFRLSMLSRFIVDTVDNASIVGGKVFDIRMGQMLVIRISVHINGSMMLGSDNFEEIRVAPWEENFAYIEDNADYVDNHRLHFQENNSFAVDGVTGYLELKDIRIDCVPQSKKHVINPAVVDQDAVENRDACALMDTSHARLLHRLKRDTRSTFVTINGQLHKLEPPKVLCVIYTFHSKHANVKAIRDTWGRRCTGFLAFSDVEDLSIPTIHIPHVGEESYRNMWQKVRAMWKYVYRHYRDEYEYFLFGGDDMYYVMDNLYGYLGSAEIREAADQGLGLYLGRQYYHPDKKLYYNTGGPGYLLDRVALHRLGTMIDDCSPALDASIEDLVISYCLRQMFGILPYNTTDNGRHRWHNFPPGYLIDPSNSDFTPREVELLYDRDAEYGDNCCSEYSIAFHHVNSYFMYDIDNYIHRCHQEEV